MSCVPPVPSLTEPYVGHGGILIQRYRIEDYQEGLGEYEMPALLFRPINGEHGPG